ncbi:hypothetical protein [Belnapia sp. F-4-1]|uniref:hypothetical protein n=1 Tax=Belnapia sp. F-4-1 TaxID=1545443 RepID=UPI0005B781B3|nr:hypothetical protein [Belnapia sp. F-4-1]
MQAERHKRFHGYVKVEVQGRAPRRWGWAIYRSDSETLVLRANTGFAYAEDAWKAGQSALHALEAGEAATPIAA